MPRFPLTILFCTPILLGGCSSIPLPHTAEGIEQARAQLKLKSTEHYNREALRRTYQILWNTQP